MDELSYLRGDEVTAEGLVLSRLYTELDLLAAESIRRGVWDQLLPAELAATVTLLIYEARGEEKTIRVPQGTIAQAIEQTVRLWGELHEIESRQGLATLREPDAGFAWAAYRWASGQRLESVLQESEITAGDFVRVSKQLIDFLEQLAQAPWPGAAAAAKAIGQVRRGVVAYSSLA